MGNPSEEKKTDNSTQQAQHSKVDSQPVTTTVERDFKTRSVLVSESFTVRKQRK